MENMHTSPANTNQMNEITHHSEITHGTSKRHSGPLSADVAQTIVSLRLTGQSISQISKALGVSRVTVRSYCRKAMDRHASVQATLAEIIPDAVVAVHKCIKAGDGKLALALLERMGAITTNRPSHVDASLTNAINILVNAPAATVAAHPSGHEGEGDDLSLRSRGQNLPKLGTPVVDAEIISSGSEGGK